MIAEGPGVEGGGDGFRRGDPADPASESRTRSRAHLGGTSDAASRRLFAASWRVLEALGPRDRSSAANGAWDDAFVAAAQRVAFHLTLATFAAAPEGDAAEGGAGPEGGEKTENETVGTLKGDDEGVGTTLVGDAARRLEALLPWPVSYTHLTLPTICSV